MPTLKEILLEKELRLESVPDAFATKVEQTQRELLRKLIRELDSLERTGGNIDITVSNIAKIEEITEELTRFLFTDTDYNDSLKEFVKEFSTQAKLTREYIYQIERFENKELYKTTLATSQKQTLEMLGKAGINQALMVPLKTLLSASVSGGASFSDTVTALTEFMDGTKTKLGTLSHYSKQIAYDAFAFTDRKYMTLVSEDLGFEWYEYFGGQLEDSRCFCVTHVHGIYHKNEIAYWGETPSLWDKKAGCEKGGGRVLETNATTIYTFLGGYNCRHQLPPVATSSVPKSAIDRAKAGGFI